MSSKIMPPNPYFVDRSPQAYSQLAIALSYATEKLNEKIKQEKIMNYKTIKSQITSQLIKREALKQIAEMDSFILKKDLNNLFNQQIADNQVVDDGLNDIYGTTGFSSTSIGEETKDEIDTTSGGIDEPGSESKSDISMQERINLIDNLSAQDIDNELSKINNLSEEDLFKLRSDLIAIEESGLELNNNVKFIINEYFENIGIALNRIMNEIDQNAGEENKIDEEQEKEFTDAEAAPVKERTNIKFTDKEQKYLKDKPAKIVKNKTQDELKMISRDLNEMEQQVKDSKTPGRTKLLNNIRTRQEKVVGLIEQQVETDDAIEVLLPSNKKIPDDPPTATDAKKPVTKKLFRKKTAGKGYGAYHKPTKKYRIMLGSAMAGNNNKELLKTIKTNQL